MFDELDTVELTHDITDHGLEEGDRGAIVNVYSKGEAYEVEFVAPTGRTIALLTLEPSDIRPIHKGESINALLYKPNFNRELSKNARIVSINNSPAFDLLSLTDPKVLMSTNSSHEGEFYRFNP